MDLKKWVSDLESRGGVTKAFQVTLACFALSTVMLSAHLMMRDDTIRTAFVPPVITKSFWVDGRTLSPEYLEQMGGWIVTLFATVTPASVDYQNQQLLKYLHPSAYGEMSVRMKVGAKRLKQQNLSMVFQPREVRISEAGQAVAFLGSLATWVADKRVPGDLPKAYLVVFDYNGSFTYVKELRETDPNDPFLAQAFTLETEVVIKQDAEDQSAKTLVAPSRPAVPFPVGQSDPVPAAPVPESPSQLPPAPPINSSDMLEALESGAIPLTPNE